MDTVAFHSASQIAREPQAIAEALSSNLRRTGDLELAEPNLVDLCVIPRKFRYSTVRILNVNDGGTGLIVVGMKIRS